MKKEKFQQQLNPFISIALSQAFLIIIIESKKKLLNKKQS